MSSLFIYFYQGKENASIHFVVHIPREFKTLYVENGERSVLTLDSIYTAYTVVCGIQRDDIKTLINEYKKKH